MTWSCREPTELSDTLAVCARATVEVRTSRVANSSAIALLRRLPETTLEVARSRDPYFNRAVGVEHVIKLRSCYVS